jgi:hypothetical protein
MYDIACQTILVLYDFVDTNKTFDILDVIEKVGLSTGVNAYRDYSLDQWGIILDTTDRFMKNYIATGNDYKLEDGIYSPTGAQSVSE